MRIPYKKVIGQEMKPGRPHIGKKPGKPELEKLYIKEAKSIRKIAEQFGCSKDMVHRSLKEYKIKRRSKRRRSQLRIYKLNYLRNEIENKGYKKVANDLGVGITTLREYMKSKE